MKVFISFSTQDRKIAQRVYGDLVEGGAEVYEFGKSESAGVSAWQQVVEWIHDSDAFVLLLSQSALKSKPIDGEIQHAIWAHYNSEAKKPAKLISAILDSDVLPPLLMKPFATLDMEHYDSGISRLLRELGLKPPAGRSIMGSVPVLPTLSPTFANLVPEPSPATTWSRNAKKLVSTYASRPNTTRCSWDGRQSLRSRPSSRR